MQFLINSGKIILTNCYHERGLIKQIPGREYIEMTRSWAVPDNDENRKLLNGWFGFDIPVNDQIITNHIEPADDTSIKYLYKHQKKTVTVARRQNYLADLSDPGTGKTLTTIEMIIERRAVPVLIVCPKSIIESVWINQLEQIKTEFNFHNLEIIALIDNTTKVNKELNEIRQLSENGGKVICIINYDKLPLNHDKLLDINWQTVILDESTKIKNPKAKRSKVAIKLGRMAKYKTIMTGTVAPNSLLDIYNQFNFLNPGIFGSSYYHFREMYFFAGGYENKQWFVKPEAIELLKNRIKSFSIQNIKRDCIDLPPLVHEDRFVDMDNNQAQYYEQMKKEMILFLEEQKEIITAPFAVTKMMKLRQMASGFIYSDNDTIILSNTKLIELYELIIDEIGSKQVIIFAHFNSSINCICKYLESRGVSYINFRKGNRDINLNLFKSGQKKILVANPASAGHGLNLQFCSNVIYFEHDFNLENYEQSLQRIERIGQKNKMTIYHLITRKTIEKYIIDKLKKKQDINREFSIAELKENL